MIHASLEEAYEEACRALGEAIVREQLLLKAIEKAPQPPADPTPQD